MIDRRQFAIRTAGTLGALAISPAAAFADQLETTFALSKKLAREIVEMGDAAAPERLAKDEKFWAGVRSAYTLNPNVVNLDHGWTNPTTRAAMDELVRGARQLEALPAEELGRLFFGDGSPGVRSALAEALGVPPAEIALVRNATEALNTVLLGLPLKAGDEIVLLGARLLRDARRAGATSGARRHRAAHDQTADPCAVARSSRRALRGGDQSAHAPRAGYSCKQPHGSVVSGEAYCRGGAPSRRRGSR